MKVVVQRVLNAECVVNKQRVSQIPFGLMLLVSFTHGDTIQNVELMAKKIANLRIFEDENQKMNLSIQDVQGQILAISQFTLYASTIKGNRPSFVDCMNPTLANDYYEKFIEIMNNTYNIKTLPGVFGADMKLNIVCDGPVTIILEF